MGGLNRFLAILAWPCLLAGFGALGFGGWVLLQEMHKAKEFEVLALAPQPQAVAIEAFDPERDVQASGEVHVIGQLDLAMQYDILAPNPTGGPDHLGVMIPIYPQGADSTGGSALAVILYDQGPGGETIGETEVNTLIAQIDGEGAVGPLISLGGTVVNPGLYRALVLDAFAQDGRTLAQDFLAIAPFRAGRAADLAYSPNLEQPVLLGMGGAIMLLLAMIGFARGKLVKREAQVDETEEIVPEVIAQKHRDVDVDLATGLVIIAAYGPEMADGSTGTAIMREVLALGRRGDEAGTYSARRDGIDDFAALDSGGLKRPLAGRAVSEKIAGPKPVKKESPLAGRQDPTQAADIMAAVQAEIAAPKLAPSKGDAGDIFAAVQAAVGNGRA